MLTFLLANTNAERATGATSASERKQLETSAGRRCSIRAGEADLSLMGSAHDAAAHPSPWRPQVQHH